MASLLLGGFAAGSAAYEYHNDTKIIAQSFLAVSYPDAMHVEGAVWSAQQAGILDMPGARIEQATYKNNLDSLTGQTIVIEGLSALQTDVLLLIQLQDGTQHSAILRPASPSFTIKCKKQ